MNCYPFHVGEPWQSQLNDALLDRDKATTSAGKSRANYKLLFELVGVCDPCHKRAHADKEVGNG